MIFKSIDLTLNTGLTCYRWSTESKRIGTGLDTILLHLYIMHIICHALLMLTLSIYPLVKLQPSMA